METSHFSQTRRLSRIRHGWYESSSQSTPRHLESYLRFFLGPFCVLQRCLSATKRNTIKNLPSFTLRASFPPAMNTSYGYSCRLAFRPNERMRLISRHCGHVAVRTRMDAPAAVHVRERFLLTVSSGVGTRRAVQHRPHTAQGEKEQQVRRRACFLEASQNA